MTTPFQFQFWARNGGFDSAIRKDENLPLWVDKLIEVVSCVVSINMHMLNDSDLYVWSL